MADIAIGKAKKIPQFIRTAVSLSKKSSKKLGFFFVLWYNVIG